MNVSRECDAKANIQGIFGDFIHVHIMGKADVILDFGFGLKDVSKCPGDGFRGVGDMSQQVDVQGWPGRGCAESHQKHAAFQIKGTSMAGKTETVEESLHGIVLTQDRIRSPGCF